LWKLECVWGASAQGHKCALARKFQKIKKTCFLKINLIKTNIYILWRIFKKNIWKNKKTFYFKNILNFCNIFVFRLNLWKVGLRLMHCRSIAQWCTAAWTCSLDMQPEHAAWTCRVIAQWCTAAWTCSLNMRKKIGVWKWFGVLFEGSLHLLILRHQEAWLDHLKSQQSRCPDLSHLCFPSRRKQILGQYISTTGLNTLSRKYFIPDFFLKIFRNFSVWGRGGRCSPEPLVWLGVLCAPDPPLNDRT